MSQKNNEKGKKEYGYQIGHYISPTEYEHIPLDIREKFRVGDIQTIKERTNGLVYICHSDMSGDTYELRFVYYGNRPNGVYLYKCVKAEKIFSNVSVTDIAEGKVIR